MTPPPGSPIADGKAGTRGGGRGGATQRGKRRQQTFINDEDCAACRPLLTPCHLTQRRKPVGMRARLDQAARQSAHVKEIPQKAIDPGLDRVADRPPDGDCLVARRA